jgi:hypothetical protein
MKVHKYYVLLFETSYNNEEKIILGRKKWMIFRSKNIRNYEKDKFFTKSHETV